MAQAFALTRIEILSNGEGDLNPQYGISDVLHICIFRSFLFRYDDYRIGDIKHLRESGGHVFMVFIWVLKEKH